MSAATSSATISVVRIVPVTAGSLKAFVDVELQFGDEIIQQKGFKVMDGANGLWVGLPSQPSKKLNAQGKPDYFDTIAFSTSLEFAIKDAILAAFESNTVVKSLIPPKQKGKKTELAPRQSNFSSPQSSGSEEDIPF
jgi:DNA-binding cell septation regulator SpoVG